MRQKWLRVHTISLAAYQKEEIQSNRKDDVPPLLVVTTLFHYFIPQCIMQCQKMEQSLTTSSYKTTSKLVFPALPFIPNSSVWPQIRGTKETCPVAGYPAGAADHTQGENAHAFCCSCGRAPLPSSCTLIKCGSADSLRRLWEPLLWQSSSQPAIAGKFTEVKQITVSLF